MTRIKKKIKFSSVREGKQNNKKKRQKFVYNTVGGLSFLKHCRNSFNLNRKWKLISSRFFLILFQQILTFEIVNGYTSHESRSV